MNARKRLNQTRMTEFFERSYAESAAGGMPRSTVYHLAENTAPVGCLPEHAPSGRRGLEVPEHVCERRQRRPRVVLDQQAVRPEIEGDVAHSPGGTRRKQACHALVRSRLESASREMKMPRKVAAMEIKKAVPISWGEASQRRASVP